MTRPRIDTAERRRRIAVRHHVAPACRSSDPVAVAGDIVGIHASDPGSVYLGLLARVPDLTVEAVGHALYEERSLLKVLGMRRTMFVTPVDAAGVIQSACTGAIAGRERQRLLQMLEGAGITKDPEGWLADVEAKTVAALGELGEATAADLTKRVPGLRKQISFGEGKKWQGKVGVSTRLLFLLASEGRIIRARPKGSWVSSLYRWAPMDGWVVGGLPKPPTGEAQTELVGRWLAAFGPGTLKDIQWWTGWTVAETKRALAAAGAVEVELDEGPGWAAAGDTDDTPDPGPWVALLPALDTTTMGWQARDWFLGEHGLRLFDRNGNAGPTVWVDGRVVGGWAHHGDGSVVYRLFDDVGAEATAAIEGEAERIRKWLADVRIVPRFRTPTEVELSA
jgi:hypothetical protein